MGGSGSEPVLLGPPMRGRLQARHSPADRVPSHGTELFATARALDLVPVDERGCSAPLSLSSLLRPEVPEAFVGFGREVLSPVEGTVVRVHDGEADHPASRGVPSVGYALTQRSRLSQGWSALAGNHLILRIAHDGGQVHLALCHLQRGSIVVRPAQTVRAGDLVARCGNSGNSTEPHLHLQVMTTADPTTARAVPFDLPGGMPRNGQIVTL